MSTANPTNDDDVLAIVQQTLAATGKFGQVWLSKGPEETGLPAGGAPAAWITFATYDESDSFTNPISSAVYTRTTRYTLTLASNSADPRKRDAALNACADAAQDALSGVSLGGLTLPAWTKLARGKMLKATVPERRMVLDGQFARLVYGYSARALPVEN